MIGLKIIMVFVIGEIGVNWNGDFKLLKEMMEKSKEIGFDAVKFQAFEYDTIKEHPKAEVLIKTAVSEENIETVNRLANDIGIEWFCTPMYPEAIKLLEPYVNKFKIRAKDGKSLIDENPSELLKKILNTEKQLIISSESNPKNSKYFEHEQIDWLYCVSKYPTKISEIDFSELSDFDGYSNHCPNIIAPVTAASLGAKIIEIHITSDKNENFVDNPVSFDYNEQFNIVKMIRDVEVIRKKFEKQY